MQIVEFSTFCIVAQHTLHLVTAAGWILMTSTSRQCTVTGVYGSVPQTFSSSLLESRLLGQSLK